MHHAPDDPADVRVLPRLVVRKHIRLQLRAHPVRPVALRLVRVDQHRVALRDLHDDTGHDVRRDERAVRFDHRQRVVIQ